MEIRWRRDRRETHSSLDARLIRSLSRPRIPTWRQLKYLPKLLSPKENLLLKGCLVAMACAVVFFGYRAYSVSTIALPAHGGAYTEGLAGSLQYANPILSQSNDVDRDIMSLVFSGLLRYDGQRAIVPDLAERYEISSDQKTYTFYLRKGVVWHDGTPFTADDVLFTIERIKDPKVKSPLYFSFKDVATNKVDDHTVQLGVSKPYAGFLDLATKRIIPKHIWSEVSSESMHLSPFNQKPIGTGPWKYASLKKDRDGTVRTYVLERHEAYYGTPPFLDKITFKLYPDIDSAINALKNKNVDGISFLPRELRDRLAKKNNLAYYTYSLPQYTAVFFNQSKNSDLSAKAVRQALALAIDRERIIREALAGEGSLVNAPILPDFIGYAPDIPSYGYDAGRAGRLLEEAGWKKNADGFLVKAATKKDDQERSLAIRLTTIDSAENARVAAIVKENWEALGVKTEIELVDPMRIKESVIDTRNYEALLYGSIIGADPDLYPFWHSSQATSPGLNLSQFSNEKADALLEKGRTTADPKARADAYIAFQKILSDELPAIFLYNPSYNYVVSSVVRGIRDEQQIVYPSDRFVDMHVWYTKTRRTLK